MTRPPKTETAKVRRQAESLGFELVRAEGGIRWHLLDGVRRWVVVGNIADLDGVEAVLLNQRDRCASAK